MKLFTLEYHVDFPRTPEEISVSVEIALGQEAELQGWQHGYTFYECQQPRQLPAGGVVYTFEVHGTYADSGHESKEGCERQGASSSNKPSSGNAAMPSELNN